MARNLSWIANAALFVLCCFLFAETANAVIGAVLVPGPGDEVSLRPTRAETRRATVDRRAILSRNLFNASMLAPAAPDETEITEEDLEATRLPLRLVGTAASIDPARSWAAVEDEKSRETLVVRVTDDLLGKASVMLIERRRLVLSENGVLRELILEENTIAASRAPTRPPAASARANRRRSSRNRGIQATAKRVERLSESRFSVSRSAVNEMARNPAEIFSQARIQPKYEDGEMVGLQISAIKSGSLFEQLGIENGETITEVNGIAIDGPEQSPKILQEFSRGGALTVNVKKAGGGSRTLTLEPTAE